MKKFNLVLFLVVSFILSAPLSVKAAEGLSGFVDFQYNWAKQTKGRGFVLNDGALYYSKTVADTEFFLDLPFAWEETTYVDGTGTATTTSTNNFKFAKDKAQAYFGINYLAKGYKINFTAGQFDVPFGVDAADMVDNPFTNFSYLDFSALPYTHTGVMVSVEKGNWVFRGILSNANTRVSGGTGYYSQGSRGIENVEVGGVAQFNHELLHATAAYLGHNKVGDAGMQSLYHFAAGGTLLVFDLDAEVDLIKHGREALQKGYLVQAFMRPMPKMTLGVRGELLSKMGNHYASQLTTGPQYDLYEHLKVKADVTWRRTQATSGAEKATLTMFNVAGVYKF